MEAAAVVVVDSAEDLYHLELNVAEDSHLEVVDSHPEDSHPEVVDFDPEVVGSAREVAGSDPGVVDSPPEVAAETSCTSTCVFVTITASVCLLLVCTERRLIVLTN